MVFDIRIRSIFKTQTYLVFGQNLLFPGTPGLLGDPPESPGLGDSLPGDQEAEHEER